MQKRNLKSPWNPQMAANVTPEEYENQVVAWLKNASDNLVNFNITHLKKLSGTGGEYEFDAVAEFEIFEGAQINVLIECKRYNRPLEREIILSLHSKLRDVGAHKAIVFSTAGFQSGALDYATAQGIATVTFIDGNSTYETRSYNCFLPIEPPPWMNFPKYAGYFLYKKNGNIHSDLIDMDHLNTLKNWLEV